MKQAQIIINIVLLAVAIMCFIASLLIILQYEAHIIPDRSLALPFGGAAIISILLMFMVDELFKAIKIWRNK